MRRTLPKAALGFSLMEVLVSLSILAIAGAISLRSSQRALARWALARQRAAVEQSLQFAEQRLMGLVLHQRLPALWNCAQLPLQQPIVQSLQAPPEPGGSEAGRLLEGRLASLPGEQFRLEMLIHDPATGLARQRHLDLAKAWACDSGQADMDAAATADQLPPGVVVGRA